MPTYEYMCKDCGHTFEIVQPMIDDPLTVCPECGGELRKVFAPPAIAFKGSGFYTTDHGKKSKSSAEKPAEKGVEKGSEKGSDKGSDKSQDKGSGKGSEKGSDTRPEKPAASGEKSDGKKEPSKSAGPKPSGSGSSGDGSGS